MEKYVACILRDRKKDEFMALKQGNMTVSTYEVKFHTLSRYATHLVTTEEERIRLFMKGLNPELQVVFQILPSNILPRKAKELLLCQNIEVESPSIESILVVCEFPEVFPTNLPEKLEPEEAIWMELLKNYDVTIQYHLGKDNMEADALSWKSVRMGSLDYLVAYKQFQAREIQDLETKFMSLGISEKSRVMAIADLRPIFIEEVNAK
ncbi:uncharacterized protein LOC129892981 [Solanum dulcamara]|uniref:uncharacterized protein LOC129892981 n=1 Tax=Solanum dulcamara TaxID=45834 RepID=UPI002486844D|nr:uncharacterized protein LOC129892981 [Solanum dulcamara]